MSADLRKINRKEEKRMFEEIKKMIVEASGVEEALVTPEAKFQDDLGIDSLDMFEMVMTFEETFGLEIPTEDLETITTVGELTAYVEKKKAE